MSAPTWTLVSRDDTDEHSLCVVEERFVLGHWIFIAHSSGWDRVVTPAGKVYDSSMPPQALPHRVWEAIKALGELV